MVNHDKNPAGSGTSRIPNIPDNHIVDVADDFTLVGAEEGSIGTNGVDSLSSTYSSGFDSHSSSDEADDEGDGSDNHSPCWGKKTSLVRDKKKIMWKKQKSVSYADGKYPWQSAPSDKKDTVLNTEMGDLPDSPSELRRKQQDERRKRLVNSGLVAALISPASFSGSEEGDEGGGEVRHDHNEGKELAKAKALYRNMYQNRNVDDGDRDDLSEYDENEDNNDLSEYEDEGAYLDRQIQLIRERGGGKSGWEMEETNSEEETDNGDTGSNYSYAASSHAPSRPGLPRLDDSTGGIQLPAVDRVSETESIQSRRKKKLGGGMSLKTSMKPTLALSEDRQWYKPQAGSVSKFQPLSPSDDEDEGDENKHKYPNTSLPPLTPFAPYFTLPTRNKNKPSPLGPQTPRLPTAFRSPNPKPTPTSPPPPSASPPSPPSPPPPPAPTASPPEPEPEQVSHHKLVAGILSDCHAANMSMAKEEWYRGKWEAAKNLSAVEKKYQKLEEEMVKMEDGLEHTELVVEHLVEVEREKLGVLKGKLEELKNAEKGGKDKGGVSW